MKFEEIVHQFQHNVFGNLTTIRSFQDPNKIWFIGSEIQKLLGHTNISQAIINAELNNHELFKLTKEKNPKFWDDFATKLNLGAKNRHVIFISESGLYKLMMRSRKPEMKYFYDWVTADVLPMLRQSVEENLIFKNASAEISQHLDENFQRLQSKRINKKNFDSGGVPAVMNYNIKNSLDHSGFYPRQLKSFGKRMGLKSKQTSSGKEVLRVVDKPTACSMSFTDSLVADGVPYEKAIEISNTTGKKLFKELIAIGITPKELTKQ